MSALIIQNWPLAYENQLEARDVSSIDLIVIHCTELPDLAMARQFAEKIRYERTQTGNSGHYYIDRNGHVTRFVADARVAHHTFRFNTRSLGIELVNNGRYPHWNDSRHQQFNEAYSTDQIAALLDLLQQLRQNYPSIQHIAGHDQLDLRLEVASDDPSRQLRRRLDPGPLFPWPYVLAQSGLTYLQPHISDVS